MTPREDIDRQRPHLLPSRTDVALALLWIERSVKSQREVPCYDQSIVSPRRNMSVRQAKMVH
jgi:hypothetical protein